MPTPPDERPPTPPDEAAGASGPDATPAEAPRPWSRWMPRRRPAEDEAAAEPGGNGDRPPEQPTEAIGPPPRPDGPARLRRDRRRLLARREEAVYHLGGLAFELYRRDRLGEEVMRRRAGEVAMLDDTVRDIDVRLGEIDRERKVRRQRGPDAAFAGCCLTCRAPFRAEARYCWQCGTRLLPATEGDEQVTAIILPVADPPPGPKDA